ncbi:MAG: hypothetical protein MJ188_05040 [Treponema sp.]|nr:hypothetical protein [Treponema sp.]
MKKMAFILLSAIFVLSFFGCKSTKVPADEGTTVAPKEDTRTEEKESEKIAKIEVELVECELPDSYELLLDGLEEGNLWYGVGHEWDQWGSHNLSLTAELNKEWCTEGEYSIKCTMEPATAETSKQATWCNNSPIEADISDYNWCAVDVYNPGPYDFNISIAIQNGNDWGWDQSIPAIMKPGAQTLLFDMSNFPYEHKANVFCFMIQQCDMETEGTVIYFDNFRLYE